MAINPMQRKSRNMFLLGFIVALIIGAGVSYFFYSKMKVAEKEYKNLENKQVEAYVAMSDMKSGDEVTLDNFIKETVQTTVSSDQFINSDTFKYIDEDTNEEIQKFKQGSSDDEYVPKVKRMLLKVDIPAGTIVTKDMLEEIDESTTADQRLQEYNMLILPSHLKTGSYIDIRLQLPEGQDYVVLSKKKVLESNLDTIWLKLREDEILTLGNAIIDAYSISGSKLYTSLYTEPGRQEAAEVTYPVNDEVLEFILNNPNAVQNATKQLRERYYDQRANYINPALPDEEQRKSLIEAGVQQEITKLQSSRQQYVQQLQGDAGESSAE